MDFPAPLPAGHDVRTILSWLNNFLSAAKSNNLKSVMGGMLQETPGGKTLIINGKTPSKGGVDGSTSYTGPFCIIQKTDTSVTVLGYNVTAPANRPWRSYVILGVTNKEYSEADITGITASGYVYLEIGYANAVYTVTAKHSTTLPAQSSSKIYHPIGWVTCADSKITGIDQWQFGQVIFPARAL